MPIDKNQVNKFWVIYEESLFSFVVTYCFKWNFSPRYSPGFFGNRSYAVAKLDSQPLEPFLQGGE